MYVYIKLYFISVRTGKRNNAKIEGVRVSVRVNTKTNPLVDFCFIFKLIHMKTD